MNPLTPFKSPIYITRPLLPQLNDIYNKIKDIWESKWLTNMGIQHKQLTKELKKYLGVNNLSLFCNGTIALQLACQALKLTGEVITTPFTFPATVNSLYQNKLKPVFCDIESKFYNIDSEKLLDLITSKTSAIMPVHVFGNPCEVEEIQKIATDNNLRIIYDAAHCFGVKYKGVPIGKYGDISMFSFHATKIFHTIEGGALTFQDEKLEDILYLLKNFGIIDENSIVLPGTNAKMNEIQAAIGLLNLHMVTQEIEKRRLLNKIYRENLKDVSGIVLPEENLDVESNYQYFPILIDNIHSKLNRDYIYEKMKKFNIFTRKYFFPLCTDYKYVKTNNKINIPNAKRISNQILCLPIYGDLSSVEVKKICDILISCF